MGKSPTFIAATSPVIVGMCFIGISSALINLVIVVFPTPENPINAILGLSSLMISSQIYLVVL